MLISPMILEKKRCDSRWSEGSLYLSVSFDGSKRLQPSLGRLDSPGRFSHLSSRYSTAVLFINSTHSYDYMYAKSSAGLYRPRRVLESTVCTQYRYCTLLTVWVEFTDGFAVVCLHTSTTISGFVMQHSADVILEASSLPR